MSPKWFHRLKNCFSPVSRQIVSEPGPDVFIDLIQSLVSRVEGAIGAGLHRPHACRLDAGGGQRDRKAAVGDGVIELLEHEANG